MRLRFLLTALSLAASSCKPDEPAWIPDETPLEPELAAAPRTGVIAGRVLTREGEGFAGLELYTLGELPKSGYCSATSGEDGAFRFENVAEGGHSIQFTDRTYWSRDVRVLCEHVEADTTGLVLTLPESARVRGTVLDTRGQPLESFQVEAITDEIDARLGARVARKTIRSREGAFELGGLPAGAFRVQARAEGHAPSFSEPFLTRPDSVVENVVVRMTEGCSLAGRVLDGRSGAPIAAAEVSTIEHSWVSFGTGLAGGLVRARVSDWIVPPVPAPSVARTDASGRFAFTRLARGPYRLRIQAAGYATLVVEEELRVEEGRTTELPPQALIRGATISGVVRGLQGATEAGAHVQLSPVNSDDWGHRSARADAAGRFTLTNVSPGQYRVSATRASLATGDPFAAIADIRHSEIELWALDGRTHELELDLGAAPR